jgi:hypothetical protein
MAMMLRSSPLSVRTSVCLAAGDVEGQAIWKRIVEAILELLRDTPTNGERVN